MSTTPLAASAAPSPLPPLWKPYLGILVPMLLTNILQGLAGTLDGIYLGQMIGVDALAAVSAFFPLFFLFFAIVIGLSSGATVLAGQAFGAGDLPAVRAVAGTALALLLGLGGAVSVLGGIFAPEWMRWLGTPPNVLADASAYARLMLIGMPLFFVLWLATSLSRSVGDAVSPLWTLSLVTAIAMACTPAFIRGWLGLPQLGVLSAAVSTLLGFAVALAWTLWHWRRSGHPLAPTASLGHAVKFDAAIARKLVAIGLPTGVQMLTIACAELVLLGLVNRHGSHATAAYGAVTQLMNWLQFPAMSLGIAATILASHAIGAGRAHRLGAIARTGQWMNLLFTGAFVAVAYAAAPAVLGWFLTDAAVIALALQLLHLVAWTMLLRGASLVLVGVMRASGTVWAPTGLGIAGIVCIELPLAWWLDARIGMAGIWWAYVATFIAMLLLQTGFYRGVWRHRQVKRLI
ncbi:MATE family efflux transporter [Sphaerotilaceae bacterium SBD11-9]